MSKKRNELCEKIYAEDLKNSRSLNEVMMEDISGGQFEMTQLDARLLDKKFEGKPISFFGDAWIRFKKNKASVAGAIIILFIVLMAIFAPMFSTYGYRQQHTSFQTLPPRIPGIEKLGIFDGCTTIDIQVADFEEYGDAIVKVLEEYVWIYKNREIPMAKVKINMYTLRNAEEHYFLFGTDNIGRDLFVRLWRGTRISLLIGFWSVVINVVIGVAIGAVSGYYGGKVDMFIQRFCEVLGGIPFLVLSILFIMILGSGISSFVLVLTITGWIGMSRMIRAQFYRYKDYEYVMASRTMGAKDKSLIFRHILPNAIGPLITQATFAVPAAIFAQTFLSYVGLGIRAPEPSIGVLLSEGQKVLTASPHLTLFPAIVVSLLMLAFNMFGNGLRDAFDPRLRGSI